MPTILATISHDPDARLLVQSERILPRLQQLFEGLAIRMTDQTHPEMLALWQQYATVRIADPLDADIPKLGRSRLESIETALNKGADYVLYSDCDRILHWMDSYPDELRAIVHNLDACDCTVIGRTKRAFYSHPRIQTDTERIINHVYQLISGNAWDVTTAARGLSRRAAQALIDGCDDDEISNDVTWLLYLQQTGGFTFHYREVEGMEFETGDRFSDGIATAGGYDRWLSSLDDDPQKWLRRLKITVLDIEKMLPYQQD